MINKFATYMEEQHAKVYLGCDDDMPDAFNDWIQELSVDDWLIFGASYGVEREIKAWEVHTPHR